MDAMQAYNSIATAVSRIQKWQIEFSEMWREGMDRLQAKSAFGRLPPEVKEAMRKEDPVKYAEIISWLEE